MQQKLKETTSETTEICFGDKVAPEPHFQLKYMKQRGKSWNIKQNTLHNNI